MAMAKTIKFNRKEIEDKIYACWLGKNIGGTMGAPFEGVQEMLDIQGYTSEKGEPLPNDDLDLQLVWLRAMQHVGPAALDANALAEYWMTVITPHWNEYGIGKANIRNGMLAPMCGEANNDTWKHSNGAWIRSEIWACLAPGFPNIALKYAIMDATIDHGLGEGTYAEIFTASLESMAFVENDIRKLIDMALAYIPEDCQVAQCVRKVIEEYDKGTDYREVRQMLAKMNENLGVFQAPANIGYVVIGLMYGEGDFKKSMIYTINCGDDTDCTGATLGSIMGIMGGTAVIPEDWKEYIGDRIMQICINGSYGYCSPRTCTKLTEWVMQTIPSVFFAHEIYMEYTDGETECDKDWALEYKCYYDDHPTKIFDYSPYSFKTCNSVYGDVIVDFDCEPRIKVGEPFTFKYTVRNTLHESFNANVQLFLPDGWEAEYDRSVYIDKRTRHTEWYSTFTVTVTANENIATNNKLILSISSPSRALEYAIPINILG
ncbi:MAG: ADP-ribosylglycohydrolase family protein [Clostridia bacterium]|nr:ADP-ribosylglycohydrolase family protein [Clostridia bacterium]